MSLFGGDDDIFGVNIISSDEDEINNSKDPFTGSEKVILSDKEKALLSKIDMIFDFGRAPTTKEIINEGKELINKLDLSVLTSGEILDLKSVVFGITPLKKIFSDNLPYFYEANKDIFSDTVVLIEDPEEIKVMINVKVAHKVASSNIDVFPKEAITYTEGWLTNNPESIFPKSDSDVVGIRRNGLLSGFPKESVFKYNEWLVYKNKFFYEYETICDTIILNPTITKEDKIRELAQALNGKFSYLEGPFKRMLQERNTEQLGATVFGEQDAEYMRNIRLLKDYYLLEKFS